MKYIDNTNIIWDQISATRTTLLSEFVQAILYKVCDQHTGAIVYHKMIIIYLKHIFPAIIFVMALFDAVIISTGSPVENDAQLMMVMHYYMSHIISIEILF